MGQNKSRRKRRVVLGLGGPETLRPASEAAAELAAAIHSEVLCVLAEQEQFLHLAGLPFARAIRPGGSSVVLTPDLMRREFDQLAELASATLRELCGTAGIGFALERPAVAMLSALLETVQPGDIVVVDPWELRHTPEGLLRTAQRLLETAEALVVPARRPRRGGSVLAIAPPGGGERVISLARHIAEAAGQDLTIVDPGRSRVLPRQASVIVESILWAAALGERSLLRSLEESHAVTVLVREG
jgi:hypothetical protein